MKKSTTIIRELKKLHRERRRLEAILLHVEKLAIGSVVRVKRRCGNPSCHCAKVPSHEQVLFLFTKHGKRTSMFVRRADEATFEKAAERYRKYRDTLRKLKHLNSEERKVLGALKASRAIDPSKPKS